MAQLCCIAICPNAKIGADRTIGYHPFPTNAEQRARWIEFVGADPARFRWRFKYICSVHFLHSELSTEGGRNKLLEGAIPMIFSPEDEEVDYLERNDVMVSEDTSELDRKDGIVLMSEEAVVEEVEIRKLFCRICLKKRSDLIPLTSKLHNAPLTDIVFTISGLKLDTDDQLPTSLCAACIEKADMAFNVRMEFIHYERILKNLVKNQQLENHYQSYDMQRYENRSLNENYLGVLMDNVKQEVIDTKEELTIIDSLPEADDTELDLESTVAPTIEAVNSTLEGSVIEETDEMYIVERLYDDDDDDEDIAENDTVLFNESLPETVVTKPTPSVQTKITPTPKKQNPDSENSPNPVYVFSWKELYKPKPPPKPKKMRKINEYRPKPELVPNTCYICDTVHVDGEALDQHLELHVGELPYTCGECHSSEFPAVLKTLVGLNRHLQGHLYPYKCDYCWQRCMTSMAYESHMQNIHEAVNGDGFTCDYCGVFFASKRKFQNHVAKHRAVEEARFKCNYCSKVFGNSALLKRHTRIHTGERPFECKKCGKRFNHEANFRNHKRNHIGEKAYVCELCSKNFINATTLKYHMAEHFPDDPQYRVQQSMPRNRYAETASLPSVNSAGQREYKCDIEGCMFVTKLHRAYYYHHNVHSRRYACDTCGKAFGMSAQLSKHIRVIHEGRPLERNLVCSYCTKTFSCKQKLKLHTDIHENNRRHKCRFCEKTFVQKVNCVAHERIHTGERPYTCRFCPTGFITSSGRKKHEKTHPELALQAQFAKDRLEMGDLRGEIMDQLGVEEDEDDDPVLYEDMDATEDVVEQTEEELIEYVIEG